MSNAPALMVPGILYAIAGCYSAHMDEGADNSTMPETWAADEGTTKASWLASKASWLASVPLAFKILIPAVIVALVATIVIVTLPHSPNRAACDSYAKSYNGFAAAVRIKDATIVGILLDEQPTGIAAALKDAHGAVAEAMSTSLDAALTYTSDHTVADSGVAFLFTTHEVAKACSADGAGITLDSFK